VATQPFPHTESHRIPIGGIWKNGVSSSPFSCSDLCSSMHEKAYAGADYSTGPNIAAAQSAISSRSNINQALQVLACAMLESNGENPSLGPLRGRALERRGQNRTRAIGEASMEALSIDRVFRSRLSEGASGGLPIQNITTHGQRSDLQRLACRRTRMKDSKRMGLPCWPISPNDGVPHGEYFSATPR